ncbi:toxin-antitoxin system HicB family antitoxin [Rhodopila globiformis]|uniref:Ribbon-helix-helix protein CopG domain-containing protein n=1 Tax=Rhodopila globiformis TaxID=1071 RepID=A0A2S6NP17_RHOGL|nr:toxin-antitoxin system HicB family antitoxin [Rhodopila globiformis]PPQ39773.1 hypothetical protein CCS01_00965 [Rhodopila globiformis]
MTTLTIELPEETYRQLRDLATARGMSLDRLIESLGSAALAAHAVEGRFRALASEAHTGHALEVLDRLDRAEQTS